MKAKEMTLAHAQQLVADAEDVRENLRDQLESILDRPIRRDTDTFDVYCLKACCRSFGKLMVDCERLRARIEEAKRNIEAEREQGTHKKYAKDLLKMARRLGLNVEEEELDEGESEVFSRYAGLREFVEAKGIEVLHEASTVTLKFPALAGKANRVCRPLLITKDLGATWDVGMWADHATWTFPEDSDETISGHMQSLAEAYGPVLGQVVECLSFMGVEFEPV